MTINRDPNIAQYLLIRIEYLHNYTLEPTSDNWVPDQYITQTTSDKKSQGDNARRINMATYVADADQSCECLLHV